MRKQNLENPFKEDHALVQARFIDLPEENSLAPMGATSSDWNFEPKSYIMEPNNEGRNFIHSNVVYIGADKFSSDSEISQCSLHDLNWEEKKMRREVLDVNNPEMVIEQCSSRYHNKQRSDVTRENAKDDKNCMVEKL